MMAAAQDVANKAATPAPVAGTAIAGSERDDATSSFASLNEVTKLFQQLLDEQGAKIKNLEAKLDANTNALSGFRSQLGGVAASQCRFEDSLCRLEDSIDRCTGIMDTAAPPTPNATQDLIMGKTGSQNTEQAVREGHSSQAPLGHAGREGRSSHAPAASILRTHSTGRSPRGGADTGTG